MSEFLEFPKMARLVLARETVRAVLCLSVGFLGTYALLAAREAHRGVQEPLSIPEWMVEEARRNGAL